MGLKLNLALAGVVAAAGVATSSVVMPMLSGAGLSDYFTDYTPPSRLDLRPYDYMTSAGGGPSTVQYTYDSSGHCRYTNKVTEYPTYQRDFPYRAFLAGGYKTSSGGSWSKLAFYVVFSKKPAIDFFEFTYMPQKPSNQTGYIKADYSAGWNTYGKDGDWFMLGIEGRDMSSAAQLVPLDGTPLYPSYPTHIQTGGRYFYFDFYYHCCGSLEIAGLRNIADVPYPHIITCKNADGTGGGTSWGNGTGGGSPGGSGGSSGSGSGGSGGSSSASGDWESDGSYPWEDDKGIPDFDGDIPDGPYTNNGEDGEGERGDTWEPPEWGVPDLPFTDEDITIPDFPADLTEGYPDFPAGMAEGYPDPYQPENNWPPPVPPPAI